MDYSKIILLFILSAMFSPSCRGENAIESRCSDVLLGHYKAYRSALSAGKITIEFFNLKYLSREIRENDMAASEISERLAKYTIALDFRQSSMKSVIGVASRCEDKYGHLLLKSNVSKNGDLTFWSVSFIEGKITNISEEDGSVVQDAYNISEFSVTDIEFN